jgi:Domain of unknown function (DUF4189)
MKKILKQLLAAGFVVCSASSAFGAAAISAFVHADGTVSYYFVGGKPTVAKARELALRNCRDDQGGKSKCVIAGGANGPAYWAVVDADDGSIGFSVRSDRQAAIDAAYAECTKRYGPCSNEAANVWFDEGQHPQANTQASHPTTCQPPTGRVLRSETYCTNGDCVRRFENGCTIHFQAPYCYDPIKQAFDWRPDGC